MVRKNSNGLGSIRKKVIKGKTYFEGRYTDPLDHRQKSVSATTEAECTRKLREVLSRITTGDYTTPNKITVEAWVTQWLENKKRIEPGTYASYESICRLYIIPRLGRVRLQDLRRPACQAFIDGIDKSPKYVRNIRGVLSAALHDAVKAEIIPKNPAADLDVQTVVKQEPRAMDSELKAAFEAAIKDSPYRNVFLFQINTGTRTSEVLGQRWKDINMRTGEVRITGQLERIRRKGDARTIKDKTKSKKNRSLFLPPFALAYLKDEKRRQNENQLHAGGEWHNDDGLVFTRADGTPIPHRTVEDAFKRIVTKLGHPEFTPHDLRRTFITEEEAAGTDIKTISAIAGHSSTDLTLNTYTASTDEMKRRAAERKQERHTKT